MEILDILEEESHIWVTMKMDADVCQKTYVKHFENVAKRVSVPGFRKGKAPLESSIQYLKNRGQWSKEFDLVLKKIIDLAVSNLEKEDPELDKRIFGIPVNNEITECDIDNWSIQFKSRFEKFPGVEVADYSEIPTLIEHKEPNLESLAVTKDKALEKGDVVAISMLGKDKDGDAVPKYTYDMLEIDLSNTKINSKIIDALLDHKSRDKVDLQLEDNGVLINLEMWIIEVREREKVNEALVEKLNLPDITTVDQLKEAITRQHLIHNSYVRYEDIMKWLFAKHNVMEPFPFENIQREASRVYAFLLKRRGRKVSFENVVYDQTRNLKTTLVLNTIAKKENFEVLDQDKEDFARDIDSHPWLYGNKKSEDIFNCSEEVLREYILQFKTLKFLISKWKFSS